MKRRDRQLGMDREITRRDFLNGVNIAVTGSLLATPLAQALAALDDAGSEFSAQMMAGYYPPTRDGLRGSHPGSFEVAHLMRDGARFDDPADSIEPARSSISLLLAVASAGSRRPGFSRKKQGRMREFCSSTIMTTLAGTRSGMNSISTGAC